MGSQNTKIAKLVLKIGRKIKRLLISNPDKFLKDISGVVHIGANTGQERERYNNYGLTVIWVEPIPDVYERLKQNIKPYNKQLAFQALITDVDDHNYEFHIANNNGASSSIYELKHHRDIWPDINYQKSISIKSTTLTSLFKKKSIDMTKHQALIMDTQGSELLVLKGAIPILNRFKYIKTEVADFESYDGCCQLPEIIDFMTEHGFIEYSRNKFAQRTGGGSYYDIIFENMDNKK
jgi:FkbM family methyltransferase